MKTMILLALLGFVQIVSANPRYTLDEICEKYTYSENTCAQIPFCYSVQVPAETEGCHAKPSTPYYESLCVGLDETLCNPAVTGCEYRPARPGYSTCRSFRTSL